MSSDGSDGSGSAVAALELKHDELQAALGQKDVAAVAKELADLLYVVYGTAVSCGIDLEPVFREVHRSNMTKVGGHKRADGKWVKPPGYSPARIEPILAMQEGSVTDGVRQTGRS